MKGIFTALLTPFNSDYSINEKSLEKLIKSYGIEIIYGEASIEDKFTE